MTDDKKRELMEKLSEDESFLSEMKQVESKPELQKHFARYGLDLSVEEIDGIAKAFEAAADLENVAGGVLFEVGAGTVFWWAIKGTARIAKKCWNAGKKFANWEQNQ